MDLKIVEKNGKRCVVMRGGETVIANAQSALDLLMRAKYEAGTKNLAIDKRLVAEEFFILSTGLAGEILQKYVNYGGRIAIYGDFSHYTSKPLKDFIYESNQGRDVFFRTCRNIIAQSSLFDERNILCFFPEQKYK